MPAGDIAYKSYCWSLGTTSFRTKNFNLTIERQLQLLQEFWDKPKNIGVDWTGNNRIQSEYYLFMKDKHFVNGDAPRKDKDAREKTSGLVDIGLVDDNRRLTEAGSTLLDISLKGDFSSDNSLQIPKDSFVYFKQLLKTHSQINSNIVRPFIVLSYLLSKLDYLTQEEYTYLLPLCTTKETTLNIIKEIESIRAGIQSVDEVIISTLMKMNNYQEALSQLLSKTIDEDLICKIGINRKSRQYDKPYYPLYLALKSAFLDKNDGAIYAVFRATKNVKIGLLWRKYLFTTDSEKAIERNPNRCIKPSLMTQISSENEFNIAFFKLLHLFKAKATLNDYLDLNRRYFKITDTVLFEDGKIHFDVIPKQFIHSIADELFEYAFVSSDKLYSDCPLNEIADCLVIDEQAIINGINDELGVAITTMDEARLAVLDERHRRFNELIDRKFDDDTLITLLDKFESRNDNEIFSLVTDNADVPTIFEYILGVIWYKVSERQGNILNFMNLSLEADLLPKTHAGGGEADILYEYTATDVYPEHSLLIEATLANANNQRSMEMEPVSRHLGQHLLKTNNLDSYCIFTSNHLNINVISDFRGRKFMPFYDTQDYSRSIVGMKIIPLETSELKKIITNKKKYKELYPIFEQAYNSALPPHEWYKNCLLNTLTK